MGVSFFKVEVGVLPCTAMAQQLMMLHEGLRQLYASLCLAVISSVN